MSPAGVPAARMRLVVELLVVVVVQASAQYSYREDRASSLLVGQNPCVSKQSCSECMQVTDLAAFNLSSTVQWYSKYDVEVQIPLSSRPSLATALPKFGH